MPAYVLFKLTPGVDPASGTLYGVGDFSSARSVESGDTLTLQADLSVEAA